MLPLRLCPLPSPLYTVLLGYKESPVEEARARFAALVRALLADFFRAHSACVAAVLGGAPDIILPVPSSLRPGGSPLLRVDGLVGDIERAFPGARWWPELLIRTDEPVGHMRPSANAFSVPLAWRPDFGGRRVLLVDDTYVSGSRAQSAAAALRRARCGSIVIVVIGRLLRPTLVPVHADFIRREASANDAAARCARCVQTAAPTE